MTPEQELVIIRAKVRAMIAETSERLGRNDFEALNLDNLAVEDLEKIRKDLHEILYAPPPRR